jgi:hypothetical protein
MKRAEMGFAALAPLLAAHRPARCREGGLVGDRGCQEDHQTLASGAAYSDPIPEIPKIKGLIAFYPDAIDQIALDGERVS